MSFSIITLSCPWLGGFFHLSHLLEIYWFYYYSSAHLSISSHLFHVASFNTLLLLSLFSPLYLSFVHFLTVSLRMLLLGHCLFLRTHVQIPTSVMSPLHYYLLQLLCWKRSDLHHSASDSFWSCFLFHYWLFAKLRYGEKHFVWLSAIQLC